tara:strand:- start:422 stop:1804 length:1383 start_codon:yes stop_codon:yes gene_type:complete
MKVRTRFAPSPTGYLHIGGLRTALYNYIYSKQNNGEFILRIEDTDQKRLVEGASDKIIKSLQTFGINFNEGPFIDGKFGPYRQSERLPIYTKYYIKLVENESAYLCYINDKKELIPEKNITKALSIIKDSNTKTPFVVKFKIPSNKSMKTFDELRGEVVFDLTLIEDPIIIKSDGFPTYHFANVVDDYLMKISHVIRGEEWLSSLPKHILLYESLEWEPPKFIHLPLLLNPDQSKLSKRQGDVDVDEFIKKGYLKDAIINFIALLGWHPDNDKEIFNVEQLIKHFSVERIQKSGSIFDIKKLDWMNTQYIKDLDINDLKKISLNFIDKKYDLSNNDKADKVFLFLKDRLTLLQDIPELISPFYILPDNLNQDILDCIYSVESQHILKFWFKYLSKSNTITNQIISDLIKLTQNEINVKGKQIFFPLRGVLYGKFHGPDLFTIISILGISESLERLNKYIK